MSDTRKWLIDEACVAPGAPRQTFPRISVGDLFGPGGAELLRFVGRALLAWVITWPLLVGALYFALTPVFAWMQTRCCSRPLSRLPRPASSCATTGRVQALFLVTPGGRAVQDHILGRALTWTRSPGISGMRPCEELWCFQGAGIAQDTAQW